MNEQELASQIVQHLDQGLSQIKQGSLYQLQSARMAAMERYRETPQPVLGFAWAGDVAFRVSNSRHFNLRNLLAAGLLVLGMMGVTYWQVALQGEDNAEIDASLLSGELPISAYLDSGFEAWLKRSSQ
jgi:predicted secreted protein